MKKKHKLSRVEGVSLGAAGEPELERLLDNIVFFLRQGFISENGTVTGAVSALPEDVQNQVRLASGAIGKLFVDRRSIF